MGLTAALSSAIAGLNSTQYAIQIASSNISNASNTDYTRKSAVLTTTGLVGMGASVASVQRATDEALQTDVTNYTSIAGLTSAKSGYLQQLNTLFGNSDTTPVLSAATEDFVSAWQTLQTSQDDTTAKADVIAKAGALTDAIQRLSNGVEDTDRQITSQIGEQVSTVNGLLSQVDTLNKQIAAGQAKNIDTTNLEDQRQSVLISLAQYTDIKTIDRSDGSVAVYTSGGQTLVDHGASTLAYDADANSLTLNGGAPINSDLRAGSLLGLVSLRADPVLDSSGAVVTASGSSTTGTGIIAQLRSQLETFAASLTATSGTPPTDNTFADAYNNADADDGSLASDFFTTSATGNARMTISVNAALLDGSKSLNGGAIDGVVSALTATTRTFASNGVNLTSKDYTGIAGAVSTALSSTAGTAKSNASVAEASRSDASTRLNAAVGVNMDDELANLQILQNAYAASAHVMSVVGDLFDTLFQAV